MSGRQLYPVFAALLSILWVAGCSTPPAPASRAESAEEIYSRASTWFTNVVFFKPNATNEADIACAMAPLILESVTGWDPRPEGEPTIVYVRADAVEFETRPHARLTYYWDYSAGSHSVGREVQGVRITLDSSGRPVIWEVLADGTSRRIVFVAESLERKAAAAFGGPLPGRRYAVEADTRSAPDVVVARVIDDGPVPMGPILYVEGSTHEVRTLICRCMPAQATSVVDTRVYRLVHTEGLPGQPGEAGGSAERRVRASLGLAMPSWGDVLAGGLRLPGDW